MVAMVDSKYKIEVVENTECAGLKKGRWAELLFQLKPQIKAVPRGKSLRVTFTEMSEVEAFALSTRSTIVAWQLKDKYSIGTSRPEMAVYIGKR